MTIAINTSSDTQMLRKVYGEFIPDSNSTNGYQLRGDWQAIEDFHAPALPAPGKEMTLHE